MESAARRENQEKWMADEVRFMSHHGFRARNQ